MRPDRIVVGEVRSGETIDMLQAMNSGHDGSLTTLHAGTPDEAILRLVLMARFGMDLPTDIIEEQIATALDLLVMSNRFPDGTRRITSLSEVSRAKDGGVRLDECVAFDDATRTWTLVREPGFLAAAVEAGIVPREEAKRWRSSLARRAA
jgi:pilus assembly protein CpaF